MVNLEDIKKDVLKSINYARNQANDFNTRDINCNDLTSLTNILSATEECRNNAFLLTKLFPGDTSIEYLSKESNSVYNLGYEGLERFRTQCKCVNRQK